MFCCFAYKKKTILMLISLIVLKCESIFTLKKMLDFDRCRTFILFGFADKLVQPLITIIENINAIFKILFHNSSLPGPLPYTL